MRTKCSLLVGIVAVVAFQAGADEPRDNKAKVEASVVAPKELADIKGRVLEVRLYKYDPRLADVAATLVEKVEVKDFEHTQGKETKKDVVLGAKSDLEPKMAYYVTVFVLEKDQRTHIGKCDDKSGICKVLTDGNPNKVMFKLQEVKK